MKQLNELKVGDKVTRLIGREKMAMPMTVMRVADGRIYCAPLSSMPPDWEFNDTTGMEIDEQLGWDGINFTGSTIIPV